MKVIPYDGSFTIGPYTISSKKHLTQRSGRLLLDVYDYVKYLHSGKFLPKDESQHILIPSRMLREIGDFYGLAVSEITEVFLSLSSLVVTFSTSRFRMGSKKLLSARVNSFTNKKSGTYQWMQLQIFHVDDNFEHTLRLFCRDTPTSPHFIRSHSVWKKDADKFNRRFIAA